MTKAKISQYDAVAGNNTDVNGVNIAEGCPPSSMNNMGREIMAALKRYQVGSDGDGVTVGGNFVVSGSTTLTSALPVASGGTGLATLTANNVVVGNGTSTPLFVAPGTSGNVLTSNGTTWASTAASSSLTGATDSGTPFETSLGTGAGAVTTGVNNTFIGFEAGNDTTSGTNNTAVGFQALDASTTGCFNTAVGVNALGANTTGNQNTAVGVSALLNNTTGCLNTAIGLQALCGNLTGCFNTATGLNALLSNNTGGFNTAFGSNALASNTTGACNAAVGTDALCANTTGCTNTAIGRNAFGNMTTGVNNIGIGINAGVTGVSPNVGIVNLTTEANRIVFGNDDHSCAQIKIAWTATSDCRDKMCFAPIPVGLDFVRALKPTEYQFKQGGRDSTATDGKRRYGFLAQEMLPLEGNNPVIISADDPDKLQYTEAHLIPVLVKAIQELTARLEQLENA